MSRLDFCQYELVDDCYDWKNDNCDECNIFKAYCEGARRAKNSIVRCKDCRWYRDTFLDTKITPTCDRHIDDRYGTLVGGITEDSFCSYGERGERRENE